MVLAACAAIVSWCYMHQILLPWEEYGNVKHGRLKAQMGDLYPRWVGTRELLLNGENPYGTEVSHEIQIGFYGHPIEQSYDKPASEIVDEQRFAYPVYVVFLLAPTIHVDFATLQRWAPVVFGTLTILSVWLWMGVLRWSSPLVGISIAVLILSSPQIAQGLRLRQFGLLVAFLIALASWCVTRERYFIAGLLLAVATIKPQMVLLCLVWFLIWTVGEWRSRWRLAAGFAIGLGALAGAGELLLPGWLRYFLEGLQAYRKYFPTTSPLRLVLGNWIGGGLSLLIVGALIAYAWRARNVTGSNAFCRMLALFLAATLLVLPLLTPYNQALLLLPLLILLRDWEVLPVWSRVAFSAMIAWPWTVQVAMLIHPPAVESMSRFPLLPSVLVLLFPFVIPVLMYLREDSAAPPR